MCSPRPLFPPSLLMCQRDTPMPSWSPLDAQNNRDADGTKFGWSPRSGIPSRVVTTVVTCSLFFCFPSHPSTLALQLDLVDSQQCRPAPATIPPSSLSSRGMEQNGRGIINGDTVTQLPSTYPRPYPVVQAPPTDPRAITTNPTYLVSSMAASKPSEHHSYPPI